MRGLMRRVSLHAVPLVVALSAIGFLAVHEPLQKAIASRIAPAYVVPSDDMLLARAKKSCEEKRWIQLYLRSDTCDFKDLEERKEAIDQERRYAGDEYELEHIRPGMEIIAGVGVASLAILALLFAIVVAQNIYRHIKENGMPGVLEKFSNLLKVFRSRKAERDFMRYKRLFDNGLLSEHEFEHKKRELKPKILQSGL